MRQTPDVYYSLTTTEREAFWAEGKALGLYKTK